MVNVAKHLAATIAIFVIVGVAHAQTQNSPVCAAVQMANSDKPASGMPLTQVQALERKAMHDRITAGLSKATAKIETRKLVDLDQLIHDKTVRFVTDANSDGPATERHVLNVSVRYDVRPVGGILTVRTDLVPVFSGIGTACRPSVTNQFSEAVDYLDDETIADAVSHLTDQLQKEYAIK